MAGLQRSVETFRRSGSSGLVWEDRFLPGENPNQTKIKEEGAEIEFRELRHSQSVGSIGTTMERNRSNGGRTTYRTGRVSPAIDPPSPKVSGCGLCGIFGKPTPAKPSKTGRRTR